MLTPLRLPVPLVAGGETVQLRRARQGDLADLTRLLADDAVSAGRGDVNDAADAARYASALDRVLGSDANDLLVAVDGAAAVVGTMQLTLIPGMARRGSTRLLIEAVRVASSRRSAGIGGVMMRWVTEVAAPELDADLVQLTSDAARTDAHRFYRALGFADSHVGFKFRVR